MLMIGVEAMPPSLPRLVTVIVEPVSSSRGGLVGARAPRRRGGSRRRDRAARATRRCAPPAPSDPAASASRRRRARRCASPARRARCRRARCTAGTCASTRASAATMNGRKVSGGAAAGRRSFRCLRSASRRVTSHLLDVRELRDAARRLAHAFGDDAAQADDLHFLGAVARFARGVGARVHRRRCALRGAGGQRGIDVAWRDAARRAGAGDGRQIEPGFGGAPARWRATP